MLEVNREIDINQYEILKYTQVFCCRGTVKGRKIGEKRYWMAKF
jgi:hypothetical protein